MTQPRFVARSSAGRMPRDFSAGAPAPRSALMVSAPLLAAFALMLGWQGSPAGLPMAPGLNVPFDAGLPEARDVLPMRPRTPPPVLDVSELPAEDADLSSSAAFGNAASTRSSERAADPRERIVR